MSTVKFESKESGDQFIISDEATQVDMLRVRVKSDGGGGSFYVASTLIPKKVLLQVLRQAISLWSKEDKEHG